jgi:hypothetical protein
MVPAWPTDLRPICNVSDKINLFRLDHYDHAVVLRFAAGGTAWELVIPDEDVYFSTVRATLRELGSRRGAEASVLLPWPAYRQARDWLRLLPDGHTPREDLRPALSQLSDAFGPILSALSLFG